MVGFWGIGQELRPGFPGLKADPHTIVCITSCLATWIQISVQLFVEEYNSLLNVNDEGELGREQFHILRSSFDSYCQNILEAFLVTQSLLGREF